MDKWQHRSTKSMHLAETNSAIGSLAHEVSIASKTMHEKNSPGSLPRLTLDADIDGV
jgi:hypothetical protein